MLSFLRRGKQTVGLDVGSGYIKIVAVDHSGTEPEVTHISYSPQAADAIVDGEVMDPQLIADTVRALLESSGVQTKAVASAVGGRDVIIKKIPMDRMSKAEAREVIRWEAEQHVPFDMENVELDFEILDPDGEGLQMEVLLVAAKREVVDGRVSLLTEAGAAPKIVDVEAFALYNAFMYNYPTAAEGNVALVNVGHEFTTVNVLQNGVPSLTRDIPFGSRRLREELRRLHGLSADEAERVIEGTSERVGEFETFLAEQGAELGTGIERAVAFLALGGVGASLDRAYLCGGGARIPGLVEAVAGRLQAPTEIANPLQRLRTRSGVTDFFPVEQLAPMLMLPVGLALRKAA
jgi:type IV pilus assembly protein PilM